MFCNLLIFLLVFRTIIVPNALAADIGNGYSQGSPLDLTQIYTLSLKHDTQILKAGDELRSAREARPQAMARLFPNLLFTGRAGQNNVDVRSNNRFYSDDNYAENSLLITCEQPLYQREYWHRLQQTDQIIARAEALFAVKHLDLIMRAASAYFTLLTAQDIVVAAKAENLAIGRELEQAKKRNEVGLFSDLEVNEAQASFDRSTATIIRVTNNLENAFGVLEELVDSQVVAVKPLSRNIACKRPQPDDITQWQRFALKQNPRIHAAFSSLEMARTMITIQRAGHYPILSLSGSYKIENNSARTEYDSDVSAVFLNLSLPLFSGGSVNSRVRQATYDFNAANNELNKERRLCKRQVKELYRGVISALNETNALATGIISAKSVVKATETGFNVGTRVMVDVLNAQRQLFHISSEYSKSKYRYILNTLSLKQVAGTLSINDIIQINSWLGGKKNRSLKFKL